MSLLPKVTIFHGRDQNATHCAKAALECLSLVPITFTDARPGGLVYVHQVVEEMLKSDAFLVILTGEDETVLVEDLRDQADRLAVRYQPRPNVLFELGLATARQPEKTILLTFGQVDLHSDIDGVHRETWTSWNESVSRLAQAFKDMGIQVSPLSDHHGVEYLPFRRESFPLNNEVLNEMDPLELDLIAEVMRQGGEGVNPTYVATNVAKLRERNEDVVKSVIRQLGTKLNRSSIIQITEGGYGQLWTVNSNWRDSIKRYLLSRA